LKQPLELYQIVIFALAMLAAGWMSGFYAGSTRALNVCLENTEASTEHSVQELADNMDAILARLKEVPPEE
jgi:Mn2+/Fe2+ NRAMP family transporter|tara:strand:- start:122 stop:334 length:213 start_codon:yes stop_codon:yes gene_type:complete